MIKFEYGMYLLDKMYNEMIEKGKTVISMEFSDGEKEAIDYYLKIVKNDDSDFKLTWDNNTLTCELIPKLLNEELATQIKSGLIKAFKGTTQHISADEAGRQYMAQYYVDHPEEFTLLLQNMTDYRIKKMTKGYTEAYKKQRAKFMKSIEQQQANEKSYIPDLTKPPTEWQVNYM